MSIEYALRVEWDDGPAEYVHVDNPEHAVHIAATIYRHYPTQIVGREARPWRLVSTASVLREEVPQ